MVTESVAVILTMRDGLHMRDDAAMRMDKDLVAGLITQVAGSNPAPATTVM